MSFRTRVFLAFLAVLVIPLVLVGIGVRREMDRRLTAAYQQRVAALVEVMHRDLERRGEGLAARLAALREALAGDGRFRLAAVRGDPATRGYLLDYAGQAMRVAGLSLLRIQDSTGRILSSGHFRNEFDRLEPALPRFLDQARGAPALVRVRSAEGDLLALARLESLRVAGRRFALVGGLALDPADLGSATREPGLSVALALPGSGLALAERAPAAGARVAGAFPLPYLDLAGREEPAVARREGPAEAAGEPAADTARIVVTQSLAELEALRRSVDAWLVAALGFTAAGALLAAAWAAARVSRPLRALAAQTAQLDLDRLDVRFATDRSDEIGSLSRLLAAMAERLRRGAARLRAAERRATLGDVARQVNHDIKNGLAPLRHVLRHLAEVAERDPAALAAVFAERRATLDSSIAYLETLARNYARLSPRIERRACDVNALVEEVRRSTGGEGRIRVRLADPLPPALADAVVLRRVLENLVGNALESLDGRPEGSVTLATEAVPAGSGSAAGPRVRIVVADTGRGMTPEELDRAFDDFYTTKPGGSGLGLSIVRRLLQDLEGSLRVETAPGRGSTFVVELPVAARPPAPAAPPGVP